MTLDDLTNERDKVEMKFAKVRKTDLKKPYVRGTPPPPCSEEWKDCVSRINCLQTLIIEAVMAKAE